MGGMEITANCKLGSREVSEELILPSYIYGQVSNDAGAYLYIMVLRKIKPDCAGISAVNFHLEL